jgi:hypothetical protein
MDRHQLVWADPTAESNGLKKGSVENLKIEFSVVLLGKRKRTSSDE